MSFGFGGRKSGLMRMGLRAIGVLLLGCAISAPAQSGLSPDEVRTSSRPYLPLPTFHAKSRLVEARVVVRDARGRPVAGLTQADFEIEDQGKRRPLIAFTAETADVGRDTVRAEP